MGCEGLRLRGGTTHSLGGFADPELLCARGIKDYFTGVMETEKAVHRVNGEF